MEETSRVGMGRALVLFFKNYFNFHGRSTRREYWFMFLWYAIFVVLAFVYFGTVLIQILARNKTGFSPNLLVALGLPLIIFVLVAFAVLIPWVALQVRRYRDAGISAWWLLATYLLPLLLTRTDIFGVSDTMSNVLSTIALALEIANWVIAAQPSKPRETEELS